MTFKAFLISPLGNRNSDIRMNADTVRKFIVDSSCQEVGRTQDVSLDVTRGDDIQESGCIDLQVITAIRNADFCIADITGYNPNVMMEVGMARALNKEIVFLKSEAFQQDALVDLGSERIITYGDLKMADAAFLAKSESFEYINVIVKRLKENQSEKQKTDATIILEKGLYQQWLSNETEKANFHEWLLSDFSRKFSSLAIGLLSETQSEELRRTIVESDAFKSGLNDPDYHLKYALSKDNTPLANDILDSIPQQTDAEKLHFLDFPVQIACQARNEKAANILMENLDYFINNSNVAIKKKYEYIGVLVSYYSRQDREGEIIDKVESYCLRLIRETESASEKASLYCQMSRVNYGEYGNTKNRAYLDKATEYIKSALKLSPDDPSYLYNLAGCLEEYNKFREAKKYIDKCMERQKNKNYPDEDHTFLAYRIYYRLKQKKKAEEYLEVLKRVDPSTYQQALMWTMTQ